MNRVQSNVARVALRAQKRTFVPPNVAVTGYPVQTQDVTFSAGARSWVAWEATVKPISQESMAKYGPYGARAQPAACHDGAIDKADQVTYNTYEGGSAVARNDRFGKETEELLIGYPNTEEKYLKKYLRPRANDEYERRVKFYGMLAVPRGMCLFAGKSFVAGALMSFGPRADMKAMASCEADLGFLEEGQMTVIMWQGKPIFIHRRTEKQRQEAKDTPQAELKDPETDDARHKNEEYAIMIAICTHLGCIPVFGAGDWGAYLCPCHGSHYDFSGRIRKGPAPLNLEIPPYYFIDDKTVCIGLNNA
eukprot:TRINITY_DN535_c0_g2_i14.p2 TRINITY_DN535_c0_g2~~TRINITY_DN535_c0_g2_i14.p2  ORF type:complete len:306 (+),score=112.32 TRINITY_DN535_c0_g2_i14:47-964(+)